MQKVDSWFPRGYKYNWDEITDGHVWIARKGEDFTCTTRSFDNQLRSQAEARNLKVRIKVSGNKVQFQFYGNT